MPRVTDECHEQASLGDVLDGDAEAMATEEEPEDDPDSGSADGDTPDPVDGGEHATSIETPESDHVEETIELGVALLAHLEAAELPLAAVIDRVETVTTDPALTREILDTAVLRGHIEREDGRVRVTSNAYVRLERDVIKRAGEYTCRRCGASISTGHFIRFDVGEHGPFGSSCIRTVMGRE